MQARFQASFSPASVRFDLDAIRGIAPNVVVLEMGSNDVCDMDSDAEAIASLLVALTELLISVSQLTC